MALNRLLAAAALAAVLGGSAWLAQDAAANFADAAGFSGRGGATCVACHTVAPFPFTPPPATAVLEGLPEAWDAGQAYALTVRVEGGPPAMPAPAPQGGFDLAMDGGLLAVPAGSEGLLRAPTEQEVTYLPAGTLMREWQVHWTAPTLAAEPRPVQVWLAVLAANGNHVVASNASDGGERLDASAHLALAVPPSQATLDAWRALPLLPPEGRAETLEPYVLLAGRHADRNATHLGWRVDGGAWQERATGPDWRLRLDGLGPGPHTVDYRSEGAGRASPEQRLAVDVPGFAVGLPGGRETPALPLPLLLAALGALSLATRSLRSRP